MVTMVSLPTLASLRTVVIYLTGQPGSAITVPTSKPLYQTVVDDIRGQIRDGVLRPGDKLPTKREMCVQYGVSGQVIDAAMMVLRLDGTVEGIQGKGIYVAGRP
jgi:GntR family transcriptional regulator